MVSAVSRWAGLAGAGLRGRLADRGVDHEGADRHAVPPLARGGDGVGGVFLCSFYTVFMLCLYCFTLLYAVFVLNLMDFTGVRGKPHLPGATRLRPLALRGRHQDLVLGGEPRAAAKQVLRTARPGVLGWNGYHNHVVKVLTLY